MCKTFRTLSMMMVVLFALFCLPGGKWLSSANATDAAMKFAWSIPNLSGDPLLYGRLYTDEVFVPYAPDSGFLHEPTNIARFLEVDLRDYDWGVKVDTALTWVPDFYPFTYFFPGGYGSHTDPIPYLCTFTPTTPGATPVVSWFNNPGTNGKSVKFTDPVPWNAPMAENDGSRERSGTVHQIHCPPLDNTPITLHVGSSISFELLGPPVELATSTGRAPNYGFGWEIVGAASLATIASSDPDNPSLGLENNQRRVTVTGTSTGAVLVKCTYSWDTYRSGTWNWEGTQDWNKKADGTDLPVYRSCLERTRSITIVD
jgi:hypothetical protein